MAPHSNILPLQLNGKTSRHSRHTNRVPHAHTRPPLPPQQEEDPKSHRRTPRVQHGVGGRVGHGNIDRNERSRYARAADQADEGGLFAAMPGEHFGGGIADAGGVRANSRGGPGGDLGAVQGRG